jgi:hypothetical protein
LAKTQEKWNIATTLESLEQRLGALEREVARLRQLLEPRSAVETPAERGARLLREARASQAALSAVTAKVYAEMGITGEPVGAEKLQQMMIDAGVNPEDNSASRQIIAMREE